MKKEALLAICIGIVVGLGVTYGIYKIRQRFAPKTEDTLSPLSNTITEATPSTADKLFITSPQNESVVYESELTLSGTTESQEMVVIFVNDRDYITQADDIGAFAVKIQLDEASNVIQVVSISSDGTEEKKDLVIVLDPASEVSTEASDEAEPDN